MADRVCVFEAGSLLENVYCGYSAPAQSSEIQKPAGTIIGSGAAAPTRNGGDCLAEASVARSSGAVAPKVGHLGEVPPPGAATPTRDGGDAPNARPCPFTKRYRAGFAEASVARSSGVKSRAPQRWPPLRRCRVNPRWWGLCAPSTKRSTWPIYDALLRRFSA